MSENTIPLRRPVVNVPDFVVKSTDTPQQKEQHKFPSEVVPLPTKGWFYPESHMLSCGEIEIKQMTAKEEDLLANQELLKKGKVLDKLLESVIINKAIRIEEILVPDRNAIFIAIRRLAYGDDYPVNVGCVRCSFQNKIKINLGELAYRPFNFDKYVKGKNEFAVTLPSGTVITYKLLNRLDEQAIEAELAQIKKISKENTAEITTRLKYIISSIDGNPDRAGIRKFVEERLTAKDSLAIRRDIKENSPDVDMGCNFTCSECSHEWRMDVPIGATFLWPDADA